MKIIVSFTSYPERIKTISRVIKTIKDQSLLPDKLVLYLSADQFKSRDLPSDLLYELNNWFEIRWCEDDLMSHKKYFYAFNDFPDDIIITIDDDIIYDTNLVSDLIKGYKINSKCIVARRGSLITWSDSKFVMPYENWIDVPCKFLFNARMDIFATTGGGTLFPPGLFGNEIFNKKIFMMYCRYADDVWLKTMQILYDIPVMMVRRFFNDVFMENYRGTGLYFDNNKDGGNDVQLNNMVNYYNINFTERCMLEDSLTEKEIQKVISSDFQDQILLSLKGKEIDKGIAIYGAGENAKRYYSELCRIGLSDKIVSFVVSQKSANENMLFNFPIIEFKESKKMGLTYFVAVSYGKQKEIIDYLECNGIDENRIASVWTL